MFTFKNQPQSIWNVMGDGFRLYGESISKIWYWQIIFMLPIIAITMLLNIVGDWLHPGANTTLSPGLITMSVLTSIITLIISIFAHCFVYKRVYAIGTQGDSTIKTSLRAARKKIWPILGGVIALVVLFALIVVPVFMLLIEVLNVGFSTLLVVGILLYLLLFCICLFVILFPLFILLDQQGIFQSIKSSITHVWGNFWRTLFLLILMSILLLAVVLALVVPLQILLALIATGSPNTAVVLGFITIPIAYLAMYAFVVPIYNAIILTLYQDLKVRKNPLQM